MRLPLLLVLSCNLGCGMVQSATRAGMMPILQNGVASFIREPDLIVAEGALIAHLKLIEGVAATYPGEEEPTLLAAMARATYAFGFVQDEIEALRFAYPGETARQEPLVARALLNYAEGRAHAIRALMMNDDFAEALHGKSVEEAEMGEVEAALAALEEEDAEALFWLVFNWGGALQTRLDPAAATQLPKIEKMLDRVLALNERVFYDAGPNMIAGAIHGFRAPAIGGNPERATRHFERAIELSGQLLPRVLEAQLVYGQTEKPEEFWTTLNEVLAATPDPRQMALDQLAKRKACRLLANFDEFFLEDPRPLPDTCKHISQKHRLRPPSTSGTSARE